MATWRPDLLTLRLFVAACEEASIARAADLAEYAHGVRGHVRLFANISSIVEFLPRDLSSFLERHPTIRVDLQERVSPVIIDAVREGAADIGICLRAGDMSGPARSPAQRTNWRLLTGLAARQGRVMNYRMYVSTFQAACHVIAENLAIGSSPATRCARSRLRWDWSWSRCRMPGPRARSCCARASPSCWAHPRWHCSRT